MKKASAEKKTQKTSALRTMKLKKRPPDTKRIQGEKRSKPKTPNFANLPASDKKKVKKRVEIARGGRKELEKSHGFQPLQKQPSKRPQKIRGSRRRGQ